MATPREHIEEIRKNKFSIGGDPNPLKEDLHHAVSYLSTELYTKDVHFLMELIQNAEDNEYVESVDPSLEFVITSRDITNTGASATLLVFNNEKGFSPKNIESICSVGRSTKKGLRKRGYIGEKGIGFKSVFLITAQPYIFSNGYQIRFNEAPCPHCNLGYIVPEWVESNPTTSVLKEIFGIQRDLPMTTLILPLKNDKVSSVKKQLSNIHPEMLLFLLKIRKLSVREDNEDAKLNTVKAISISKETDFVMKKNIDAESFLLHLSTDEEVNQSERECIYHIWRQRFRVMPENKVERRMEVDEWVITLAFPMGERLNRGTSLPGIYAFLPTEMVTNFPFIIQADFLLTSSRETILQGNKWNQGILNCVPIAFVNAFTSLVNVENAPVSSLPRMFKFLPANESLYEQLNEVRDSIKGKLACESIIPCESYVEQKFMQKSSEVGRLLPGFWNVLHKAREQGVKLHNISSHGIYILSSSFDKVGYNQILNFLGVQYVENEWYVKCTQSSNMITRVSEDVYMELLSFFAKNWSSHFQGTSLKNIPLLKYIDAHGNVLLCSLKAAEQHNPRLLLSNDDSWLIDWNAEFRCISNLFFLPQPTQNALWSFSGRQKVKDWLESQVEVVTVYDYAFLFVKSLNHRSLVVTFAHFLYHSLAKSYLSDGQVRQLCQIMPLVDNYGSVVSKRSGIIVPADGSNWSQLIGSNLWRNASFVELGGDYLVSRNCAGLHTSGEELLPFLKSYAAVLDIPDLSAPYASIPSMNSLLTKKNAFLLLDWIRNLRRSQTNYFPESFLKSIKCGKWLKISLNGCSGFRSPSESFLLDSSYRNLLQKGSVFVDIPLIDESFYGCEIHKYKEELKIVGVMFEYAEVCRYIGKHLMSLATSSTLTRTNVFSMLNFIRFLSEKYLPLENFINTVKDRPWMRTSRGDRKPHESVLYDQNWKAASQISDIPFIDKNYYGEEILCFKKELQLLGVLISFNGNYQIVVDNLKSPICHSLLSVEAFLLVLDSLRSLRSSSKLLRELKGKKCITTNIGPKPPTECFLLNPEWGCLLKIFPGFSFVDENFYGESIFEYINELQMIGIRVHYSEAAKEFSRIFKQRASPSSFSIRKEEALALLACLRELKKKDYEFPKELDKCIHGEKWLRTRLGDYRSPKECILFGLEWESISSICLLPVIDDSNNYYGKDIYEYRADLESMGVIVDFRRGAEFVISCLYFPQSANSITPASVHSLLKCVKNFLQDVDDHLPSAFIKRVSTKWLKTSYGYKSPDECLLFNSKWDSYLKREDGPFIDEKFYDFDIVSYKKEINALGVTVDVASAVQVIASYLDSHSNFATICRIYNYLNEFNWEPSDNSVEQIWIPKGVDDGDWVSPDECVLYDKENLFSMLLNVLEKHYDKKLLNFFSTSYGIKSHPTLDDYCKVWKEWEDSKRELSLVECCAFWGFVAKKWGKSTQETLSKSLFKVPVKSSSGAIVLCDKNDVFIADDLYLKDLFQQSYLEYCLFVWYPESSVQSLSRTKLLEIYSKIGVRNLSESVQKEELFIAKSVGSKQVDPKEFFIRKGLLKIILAFLANPSLEMDTKKRLNVAKGVLEISICEALEPIKMGYNLTLSSGETLIVESCRMIRLEKKSSMLFMEKMGISDEQRSSRLKYATYFSEALSEMVLWEQEDHMYQLSELIKLGFLVEFDEGAIDFLLKNKNLQVFVEEEEFLSSAFPSTL